MEWKINYYNVQEDHMFIIAYSSTQGTSIHGLLRIPSVTICLRGATLTFQLFMWVLMSTTEM
jgi:hypothetical protein